MGKRSNFERKPRDLYPTPFSAAAPLFPHLAPRERFCEPCAGDGRLVRHLEAQGHVCAAAWDIEPQAPGIAKHDATTRLIGNITCFITNPPWTRGILHRLIMHLSDQHPTWLLLDADWMHTLQAEPYLPRCSLVVTVGRVKWIAGSKHTGLDNCCWYRFERGHTDGPRVIGRKKAAPGVFA